MKGLLLLLVISVVCMAGEDTFKSDAPELKLIRANIQAPDESLEAARAEIKSIGRALKSETDSVKVRLIKNRLNIVKTIINPEV